MVSTAGMLAALPAAQCAAKLVLELAQEPNLRTGIQARLRGA